MPRLRQLADATAGVRAGTDKGKAEVYKRIMAGAVYNMGKLRD